MPDDDDPWGLATALRPPRARMTPPPPASPVRLVMWGLAAAVAITLVVVNVLLVGSRGPGQGQSPSPSEPTPSISPTSASATTEVSTLPRPLAAYVFPGSVGSYLFVSKGSIGDDEVGYYSRGKEALLIHKNSRADLRELASAAGDVVKSDRFWCWSTLQGEQQCGAQLRDGVVLLVAKESQTTIQELMTQALKGV